MNLFGRIRKNTHLPKPEHIFQLVAGDLRSDFPPPGVLTHTRPNLPSQANSFTGRQHELERTATLLGVAEALRSEVNIEILANERVEYDRELVALRREMNEQKIDYSWSNGRAMTTEETIEYALLNSE